MLHIRTPVIRALVWMGDSQRALRNFPKAARSVLGYQMQAVQFGRMPLNAKPMRDIGPGVIEIALRHDTNAYRSVMAVQLGEKIFVLHVFQEKSKRGIKTSLPDLQLIRKRYAAAKELADNEKKKVH